MPETANPGVFAKVAARGKAVQAGFSAFAHKNLERISPTLHQGVNRAIEGREAFGRAMFQST